MNRDEKLKTFKWIKLKHSIRFVYLSLPIEIDSFKKFYLQNEYFLEGKSINEIYKEFIHYQFIQLCKKWMVYPCLSKKEILDFYEEEMNNLLIER
jgi:hypothetical protein